MTPKFILLHRDDEEWVIPTDPISQVYPREGGGSLVVDASGHRLAVTESPLTIGRMLGAVPVPAEEIGRLKKDALGALAHLDGEKQRRYAVAIFELCAIASGT